MTVNDLIDIGALVLVIINDYQDEDYHIEEIQRRMIKITRGDQSFWVYRENFYIDSSDYLCVDYLDTF